MDHSTYTYWLETGNGPGAEAAAIVPEPRPRHWADAEYATYAEHTTACPACRDGREALCPAATALWAAYRAARRIPPAADLCGIRRETAEDALCVLAAGHRGDHADGTGSIFPETFRESYARALLHMTSCPECRASVVACEQGQVLKAAQRAARDRQQA